MKKIYFFIGTTAELIKLSPVIRELERRKIKFKIIVSGQASVNFEEMSFLIKKNKGDISFKEKANKTSMIHFLVWAIRAFFNVFTLRAEFRGLNKSNSYFIVHGDTVSSLIGAVWAKIYGLKLVHIESGLRSFSFIEPFPEEICRWIVSRLADVHFCPNKWSVDNLSKIPGVKVDTFENTLIESFQAAQKDVPARVGKKYFVLTAHRQEHIIFEKERTRKLIEFIIKKAELGLSCVFVSHAVTFGLSNSLRLKGVAREVVISPRLTYLDFVKLLGRSEYLITDGGSNQEEAYYMGLPCLLLRNCTERIEGLGENVVLSKNNKKIIKHFLKNYKSFRRDRVNIKVRPSKIIVDYLLND